MTAPLELVTIGRVSVDLYPEQTGPMRNVRTLAKSIGGTTTNVAVAAARLGHRVATVTKVGDDLFGRDVVHSLEHDFGVDATFVTTHPSLKTALAFVELDPPEDPTIVFYREPRAPDSELLPADLADVPIEDVPILWVPASQFAVEPTRSTTRHALTRRSRRAHTVLDLDWRPTFWQNETHAREHIAPLLHEVSIAVGNRTECRIAVGSDDPDIAADRLLACGLDAAIVKLGADGVMVALPDGTRETVPAFRVDVVCGLGAGDAFGGALCHGLLSGWSIVESVRYGNAAGAIVAGRLRCADDMPTLDEIDALIRAGSV